jgi:FkbM family methyltransferase
MKVDGTIGPMMFAGDTEVDGITEVPRVPTAAIAFRKTELRFCELYKHSGFEDDHFCAEMQERFPAGKIVINNRCKLIHINEQKGQSEGWEENKKIFDSIWETSKDGRTRTRKKMKTSPSYHSEYGEDKWLEENVFKGKTGGVFFEAGAIDGIVCSNTLFFEQERGWTGLCVEANPVMFAELKRNRSCKVDNVAIYDRDGEIDFMAVEGPLTGWGGIVEAIEKKHENRMEKEIPRGCRYKTTVPCITLEGMLRKHNLNKIDLLSLDIEGAEFKVLEKFPFNEFDIEVFAIENNFGTYPFEALMSSNGYEKIINLGVTEIYQRHT